jgi:hypothetical protein
MLTHEISKKIDFAACDTGIRQSFGFCLEGVTAMNRHWT